MSLEHHGYNELGITIKKTQPDWSDKLLSKMSLLNTEISPDAVMKVREICQIAEINLKRRESNEDRIEDSLDALALTILESSVMPVTGGQAAAVIEAGNITAALAKLSPLFPFSS